MEIIHLILGKANPDRMNGVNRVVYQLTTQQALAGKKVSIWGISKNLDHNYGKRNFETRLFKAHKNPFKIDRKLKEELLQLKGEAVIHLHGGWVPIYGSLSTFLYRNNIPFVLTPHGSYNNIAMNRSGFMKKVYFQLFEKNLLKRVNKIHSLGESEIEGLKGIFPNTKSFLIPYGFDFIESNSDVISDSKEFIIGFVGRLDIYTKGLDLLISAFSNFSQKHSDVLLWMIGDSHEKVELENLIQEKELTKKITLFGSKFGDEKNDLIQQMTIFTHPSRNEGLPTAVLEASCFGVPCVISKATNVSTYINNFNAGISINNESVVELEEAFEVLYEKWKKNDLIEMKSNAQKMVLEAFNWKNVVENFDVLYKD
jgi:glycosyltransferase involved in cell wall biosynthesis